MADSGAAGRRAAQRLAGGLTTLIESYEQALLGAGGGMLASAEVRQQWVTYAGAILGEVCRALHGGSGPRAPAEHAGADLATAQDSMTSRGHAIHPVELFRAASLFLDFMLAAVRAAVEPEDNAVAMMAIASQTAHNAVTARVREGVSAHSSYLLSKIHDAHLEERARIARELHDRLGSSVSAAARCVESLRVHRVHDPTLADKRIAQAEEALHEAVEEVRRVARDLRLRAQISGLETALLYSARTAAPIGVETLVVVTGDEDWAPPAVLDELFLVLREAMRNAYAHAEAANVVVRVKICPHEMLASVTDDGKGMDPARQGDGLGLVAMRERMALMGGAISICSRPGSGTSVETQIPLYGFGHVA